MRKAIVVSLVLVLVVAFAAGGQTSSSKPVTVMLRESSKPAVEKVIADYTAATGRQVEVTRVPIQNYFEQVSVVLASGTAADMWEYWGVETGGYYVDKGFVADVTAWAKSHSWSKKFNPAALQIFVRNGVQFGMPLTQNAMFLFYQKPLFAKYGLTAPKTYAQLLAAADKLKANGIYPFSVGAKDKWHLMRITDELFEKYCGDSLRNDLLVFKTSWNRPEVLQAYAELKRWADKGYFNAGFLGVLQREAKMLEYQGKTGMILEGQWWEQNCKEDGQDASLYDFFIFPKDRPDNRTSVFCEGWLFNSKSENLQGALNFAEYYTSLDEQTKYVTDFGLPSAVQGVKVPADLKIMNKIQGMLPTLNGFNVTDQGMPAGLWEEYAFVEESIITGSMTPEQGAKYMDQKGKAGAR